MSQMNTPVSAANSPFVGINPSGMDPTAAMGNIAQVQTSYLQRKHQERLQAAASRDAALDRAAAMQAQQQQADLRAEEIEEQKRQFDEGMAESRRIRQYEIEQEKFSKWKEEQTAFELQEMEDQIDALENERKLAMDAGSREAALKVGQRIDELQAEKTKKEHAIQATNLWRATLSGFWSNEEADQLVKTLVDTTAAEAAVDVALANRVRQAAISSMEQFAQLKGKRKDIPEGMFQARIYGDLTPAIIETVAPELVQTATSPLRSLLLTLESEDPSGPEYDKRVSQAWEALRAAGMTERQIVGALKVVRTTLGEGGLGAMADATALQAQQSIKETEGMRVNPEAVGAQQREFAKYLDRFTQNLDRISVVRGSDGKRIAPSWTETSSGASISRQAVLDLFAAMAGSSDPGDLRQRLLRPDITAEELRSQGKNRIADLWEGLSPKVRQTLINELEGNVDRLEQSPEVRSIVSGLEEMGLDLGELAGGGTFELERDLKDIEGQIEAETKRIPAEAGVAGDEVRRSFNEREKEIRSRGLERLRSIRGRSYTPGDEGRTR